MPRMISSGERSPFCEKEIAVSDARVSRDAARRVAGGAKPQLARRVGIQQIASAARRDRSPRCGARARLRHRTARCRRVRAGVPSSMTVTFSDATRSPRFSGQERRFAIDGIALHGVEDVAEQRSRGDGIEDHGHFLGGDFARAQTADGSLRGAASHCGRAIELGMAARRRIPKVALHRVALARHRRGAEGATAGSIAAQKSARVGEHALAGMTRRTTRLRSW